MNDSIDKKGVLGWFASNHVAANLLMAFIVIFPNKKILAIFAALSAAILALLTARRLKK